jgi:hypothetical protein
VLLGSFGTAAKPTKEIEGLPFLEAFMPEAKNRGTCYQQIKPEIYLSKERRK